jgi:hypothetical protein
MQCERIPVGEKYNKEIETICSAVQVPVLISSISRNTATHERHSSTADPLGEALEMIALRAQSTTFPNFLLKWRQRNTEKVVRAPNHRSSMYKHPPDPDPWQMRKEFLRLRPDRKSVLEFGSFGWSQGWLELGGERQSLLLITFPFSSLGSGLGRCW